eukprot:5474459-Pyramimonas_sp.AAC.1
MLTLKTEVLVKLAIFVIAFSSPNSVFGDGATDQQLLPGAAHDEQHRRRELLDTRVRTQGGYDDVEDDSSKILTRRRQQRERLRQPVSNPRFLLDDKDVEENSSQGHRNEPTHVEESNDVRREILRLTSGGDVESREKEIGVRAGDDATVEAGVGLRDHGENAVTRKDASVIRRSNLVEEEQISSSSQKDESPPDDNHNAESKKDETGVEEDGTSSFNITVCRYVTCQPTLALLVTILLVPQSESYARMAFLNHCLIVSHRFTCTSTLPSKTLTPPPHILGLADPRLAYAPTSRQMAPNAQVPSKRRAPPTDGQALRRDDFVQGIRILRVSPRTHPGQVPLWPPTTPMRLRLHRPSRSDGGNQDS